MPRPLYPKTVTRSLALEVEAAYAWLSDPQRLGEWLVPFCRSTRRENDGWVVESPRGPIGLRVIRDDRARIIDLILSPTPGASLVCAIRVLEHGSGCEVVATLVPAAGIAESIFHEHSRWLESAVRKLKAAPPTQAALGLEPSAPAATPVESAETQAPETPSESVTGKKLFIGNLPFDWTDEQLKALFEGLGTLTLAEIARFRGRSGRSRGFGFAEFSTEEEAKAAIDKLHGTLAGGRTITVRLTRPKESRAPAPATEPVAPAKPIDEPAPSPRHSGRRDPSSRRRGQPPRNRQDSGIVTHGGYEIFPRRKPGQGAAEDSGTPQGAPQISVEPSPYFDDTGDFENHGRGRRRRR